MEKKRGEQKHINSWKVSDSSPKGYGAPKAMGNSTLVFFSCLKGLLGVWLSSRFVYIYISVKELTENVGSLMSLSCLTGSFSASWTELPLQCFYLPWKNNALWVKDQLIAENSSCTKKRDVMMSGHFLFPSILLLTWHCQRHKALPCPVGDPWCLNKTSSIEGGCHQRYRFRVISCALCRTLRPDSKKKE